MICPVCDVQCSAPPSLVAINKCKNDNEYLIHVPGRPQASPIISSAVGTYATLTVPPFEEAGTYYACGDHVVVGTHPAVTLVVLPEHKGTFQYVVAYWRDTHTLILDVDCACHRQCLLVPLYSPAFNRLQLTK